MDFNTEENRKVLLGHFPQLGKDQHYELLSEETPVYNCIAWAMGFTDRWVDIYMTPGHWWPDGVQRNTSPQALLDAFLAVGFEKSDNIYYEKDYDKVVLYQENGQWTHASRIENNNVEYSKFGQSFDGVHSHHVFSGSIYGNEYAYMRRHVSKRGTEGKNLTGSIKINLVNLIL